MQTPSITIRKTNKTGMVVFICFIAALAGLLFGLDLGYVNGALQLIQKEFQLNTAQTGTVTGILMLGAALGALICGFLSQKLGRKKTLALAALLFALFSIISMFAPSYRVLLASRFMLGCAVGIAAFITPLYLSEIAPRKIRGGLISMYHLMLVTGVLIMFISNHYLAPYGSWRLMMVTISVPAIIMFFCCLFLPKSPRWLVLKGNIDEARAALFRVRHEDDVNKEIEEIEESVSVKRGGLSGLWKTDWLWKVVLLGMSLQVLQQLTGMNVFNYYSTEIFSAAGFGDHNLNTIVIGSVNVLTACLGLFVIDKFGRKPLLYVGLTLLIIALATIGHLLNIEAVGSVLSTHQKDLLFSASLLVAFSFAISIGSLSWVMCAEICPLQYRNIGLTFSTVINLVANMLIGRYALSMFDTWGYGNTFYVFSVSCFIGILLVKFFVPETKGVSLEKMEQNLRSSRPLRRIGDF